MSDALFMLPFYLTAQGTTTHIHREMAASKQQQRYSGTGAISRLISSLSGFLGAVAVVLKAVTSSRRRRGGVIENHHSFCLTKKNDGRLYSEREVVVVCSRGYIQ